MVGRHEGGKILISKEFVHRGEIIILLVLFITKQILQMEKYILNGWVVGLRNYLIVYLSSLVCMPIFSDSLAEHEPQTPRDYMLKVPDSDSGMVMDPVPQQPHYGYGSVASCLKVNVFITIFLCITTVPLV